MPPPIDEIPAHVRDAIAAITIKAVTAQLALRWTWHYDRLRWTAWRTVRGEVFYESAEERIYELVDAEACGLWVACCISQIERLAAI